MKITQSGFIAPLLLIIIALVLAGGGAYVYTQTKSASQSVAESVVLPQATSTTQSSVDSQTADWKTYRNEIYGFTLLYPQIWEQSLKIASEPILFSNGTQGETLSFSYRNDLLFSISIYTKSQWILRLKDDYPNPVYLAENATHIFAYSAAQNGVYRAPDSVLKDVSTVLRTFKVQ